jgi:hypothetical protein
MDKYLLIRGDEDNMLTIIRTCTEQRTAEKLAKMRKEKNPQNWYGVAKWIKLEGVTHESREKTRNIDEEA